MSDISNYRHNLFFFFFFWKIPFRNWVENFSRILSISKTKNIGEHYSELREKRLFLIISEMIIFCHCTLYRTILTRAYLFYHCSYWHGTSILMSSAWIRSQRKYLSEITFLTCSRIVLCLLEHLIFKFLFCTILKSELAAKSDH